jgi:hypothetical protein
MGLISSLVCEHPLPVPFDTFSEDEREDFKDTKWDEIMFYTSSFFDSVSDYYGISNYTISEDGQFYKNEVELEFIKNEKGVVDTKEKDMGVEKLDFTGEIHFGTEVLGNEYDYSISFIALFFKGELKELNLSEWNKRSNEKRKKMTQEIYNTFKEKTKEANKLSYKISYAIKWLIFKFLGLVTSVLLFFLKGIAYAREWMRS